jgi:hypothetical protein
MQFNHKRFWWDFGVFAFFLLLGILNIGTHNVAAAVDFFWCGYFVGRAYKTIIVVEATKK